jgi:hypothetical protein
VARELRQRLTERFTAEGFKAPAPVLAGAGAGTAVP